MSLILRYIPYRPGKPKLPSRFHVVRYAQLEYCDYQIRTTLHRLERTIHYVNGKMVARARFAFKLKVCSGLHCH